MDEETTPVEAGLGWLLGKKRKERGDFPGAPRILEQLRDKSKVLRKRVGIVTKAGPPPRSHMPILDPADPSKTIGEVTSGVPSPSLSLNLSMGYVSTEAKTSAGSPVQIQVRNQVVTGEIAKMPFLKGKYFLPPKN
jgi:aminomethyltransferase